MPDSDYSAADVADQQGKTFFITGANTGIGFAAAQVLAARRARVLLGCRSPEKARAACAKILSATPEADVEPVVLDLASLASVKQAAQRVEAEPRLDVIINNAGVMAPPKTHTRDGFELQFGVNHLGHFALTNLLLPKLAGTPERHPGGRRIVTVSSAAHKMGRINFADPHAEHSYQAMSRYAMSKLSNLLFTLSLRQRLEQVGTDILAVACHPGGASTDLGRHFPTWANLFLKPLAAMVINSAAQGALPTLRAATHPGVCNGDYFGPAGWFEMVHSAERVQPAGHALDEATAERLWALSVQLTDIDFLLATAPQENGGS